MEISRQADYAIRAIMDLAALPDGELVQTREIARRQNIPERYLPTIIRTLARAGLLRTLRGSHGGVTLARNAGAITIRDVIEAIDGPLLLNRCMIRPGECGGNGKGCFCSLHDFWQGLVDEIEIEMDAINFADLVAGRVDARKDFLFES